MPVKVMLGPGRGPGPALNVGIAATHVDVIVRMDGHARAPTRITSNVP
jgi:hypothetical protein